MIKIGEKTFFLTDAEGNETPWSVTELQSELIYCFVSTGFAENSCFAEDVALAVEYSMHQEEEHSANISVAEMSDIVIKTLENAGFFTVAECFRKRNSRDFEILYSVNPDSLKILAMKHGIFNQAIDNENVIAATADSFTAMKVDSAPLGLIIEMLRFHYRHKQQREVAPALPKKKIKGDYLFYYKDVANVIPVGVKEFADAGVIRVNDVTVYHPSIRIYLDIMAFAELRELKPILTEMEWNICGNELGQSFDALIEVMQQKNFDSDGDRELPVYLTINNMEKFTRHYFGTADGKDNSLPRFIVENLAESMFNVFYKVRF